MNSSTKAASLACAILLATGAVLQPLRELVGRTKEGTQPAALSSGSAMVTAPGVSAAMLGGLRGLAADGLWLKTYLAWAARDLLATERLIRLVTIADDRPVYFWLNGARIMAYDISEWRLAARPAGDRTPENARRVVEEQAQAALGYLAEAYRCHPASSAICVEAGNINLYRRNDPATAAEWYRRAAGFPDAPYYVARIYGELLRRRGQEREAYTWLCQLHPGLPVDDPDARSQLVLDRIRELEKRLSISSREQYMPDSSCELVRTRN